MGRELRTAVPGPAPVRQRAAAGAGGMPAGRPAVRDLDLEHRARGTGAAAGALRRRQVHAAARPGRRAGRRRGRPRKPGGCSVDGRAASEVRGRAGLMQQDPESQVVLSRVGDDVAFGAREPGRAAGGDLAPGRATPSTTSAWTCRWTIPTSALSGGQKQRLALAGMLAMRPGCCCWTSRPPTWTRRACWRSATPWPGCWTRPAPPWWWSSTGWPSGPDVVDRVVVLARRRAACSQTGRRTRCWPNARPRPAGGCRGLGSRTHRPSAEPRRRSGPGRPAAAGGGPGRGPAARKSRRRCCAAWTWTCQPGRP